MSTLADVPNIFPLNNFTLAELTLINSAVVRYIDDERVADLKESLLRKIADDVWWRTQYLGGTTTVFSRSSADSKEAPPPAKLVVDGGRTVLDDITLELNSSGKTPVFKFLKCPDKLSLTGLGNSLGKNVVMEFVEERNSYSDRSGVRIYRDENSEEDGPIALSDFHMELLVAFYIYHSLRARGVDLSGTPTTSPLAEG